MNDHVALVTGASRGIGLAIARQLANAGCKVIGTATSDTGAAGITAQLVTLQPDSRGMVLDVNDPFQVESLVEQIERELGPPTILVNNAGITRDALMLRMKQEDWDTVINTDLSSLFRVTKACLKGMTKARWGRIVNITSVVGAIGNVGQVNYAAAKAGIMGFTKSLAREIASRNITVNAVAPGFIVTDMTSGLPEAVRQNAVSSIPLQRFGEPEEIAHAVAFLCSGHAAYITGQTLHINGGMYMD